MTQFYLDPEERQEQETAFAAAPQTAAEDGEALLEAEDGLEAGALTETEPEAAREMTEVEAIVALLSQSHFYLPRGFIVTAWNLLLPFLAIGLLWALREDQWQWALCSGFFLATIAQLNRLSTRLEHTHTAFQVANLDIRHIGALAEALDWPSRRVRSIASLLLAHLLPHLTEQDAALFNEEQLSALYHRLTLKNASKDPDLIIAILKAMPHIGDAQALPYVERLTQITVWSGKHWRVRQAARECIPALEKRVVRLYEAEQAQREAADAASAARAQRLEENANRPVSKTASFASEEMQKQLEAFEEERRKRQPGMRMGFLIASWCVIFPYFAVESYLAFAAGAWPLGLLFGTVAAATTQMHRFTLSLKQKEMLSKLNDKHGVGALALALEWPDTESRDLAAAALSKLLPQLNASDYHLLDQTQRLCLYHKLHMSNARTQPRLMLAILKALEQIGDQEALPYVKRLAEALPEDPSQRRIHDAAQDCLPLLEICARQNSASQTLLRASSAVDMRPETLLRPASATETPSEELLRSSAPSIKLGE